MHPRQAILEVVIGDTISLPKMTTIVPTVDSSHTEHIDEGREATVVEVDGNKITVEILVLIPTCYGELEGNYRKLHRITFVGEARFGLRTIRRTPPKVAPIPEEIGGW